MKVDATSFAKTQLDVSLQIIMQFNAANIGMNETDFELKIQEQNYKNPDFFDKQFAEYQDVRKKEKFEECSKCK